jgi:hypothetical protein
MDKVWYAPDGKKIACTEKLKVMQQNMDELMQFANESFEDGILMGIDPQQLRECFADLMLNLTNPYENKR